MFECPSCGGELRFDIETQGMLCPFCNSAYDPKTVEKGYDAEEQEAFGEDGFGQEAQNTLDSDTFEATVFTCPQCGGEIFSMDTEATTFCSFCGASTILSSRLSQEKKPDYIIPFQITKDECKSAYKKMMKSAFFAPKDLKDENAIEKFRAIYMPYWVYDMRQDKNLHLQATKCYRSGNYRITEDYVVSGNLNAYYKGVSYDASSSFADNISENIAPYDVKGMSQFYPAYLAGFYADTADVDSQLYMPDVEEMVNDATLDEIAKLPELTGKSLKKPPKETMNTYLGTKCNKVDRAMFPVWFLSYRKGDRVAYATVNGQTGKVASDLPVDVKKYLLVSLAIAVPLFLLLNLFLTASPGFVMLVSAILALIMMFVHVSEIKEIGRTELQLDNKGYLSKQKNAVNQNQTPFKKSKVQMEWTASKLVVGIAMVYLVCMLIVPILGSLSSLIASARIYVMIILLISIFPFVKGLSMYSHIPQKYRKPGFIWGFAALVISAVVTVFNPVSDWIYYAGAVASLAAVLCTMFSIIHGYNILSTRPLPQLNKRGGEEHE